MKRTAAVIVATIALVALLTACGDDSNDSASTTTGVTSTEPGSDTTAAGGETKAHTEATAEELEVWQRDLDAVGCYVGPIDGDLGPQTEAAIKAFQAAQGLTVDGLLGPATKGALEEAAAAGTTVCSSTTTTTPTTGSSASLTSASYDKTFVLGTCSLNADLSNISLRGQADGLTLVTDVTSGTGTLGVSGGTESDGITLNGNVSAATVNADRSFTATGTFGAPNNAGETFTLTGSCPG